MLCRRSHLLRGGSQEGLWDSWFWVVSLSWEEVSVICSFVYFSSHFGKVGGCKSCSRRTCFPFDWEVRRWQYKQRWHQLCTWQDQKRSTVLILWTGARVPRWRSSVSFYFEIGRLPSSYWIATGSEGIGNYRWRWSFWQNKTFLVYL